MKRNTFSVLCYARKREQGKDKQYPIMVRITIDSEQVQFNSQLMVDKKMWKDGGVVGRSATAVYLRTQIEKIKTDITRIYEKEIENNRYPSPLKLKNIYLGIETKANTLLTVFKKMNEEKRKEVGTSLRFLMGKIFFPFISGFQTEKQMEEGCPSGLAFPVSVKVGRTGFRSEPVSVWSIAFHHFHE